MRSEEMHARTMSVDVAALFRQVLALRMSWREESYHRVCTQSFPIRMHGPWGIFHIALLRVLVRVQATLRALEALHGRRQERHDPSLAPSLVYRGRYHQRSGRGIDRLRRMLQRR